MEINTVLRAETVRMTVEDSVKVVAAVKEVADEPITATAVTGIEETEVVQNRVEEDAEKKIADVKDAMGNVAELFNLELGFEVDRESDKVIVKFIDSATGETVKQIPSEEALAISERISDMKGILVDIKE